MFVENHDFGAIFRYVAKVEIRGICSILTILSNYVATQPKWAQVQRDVEQNIPNKLTCLVNLDLF